MSSFLQSILACLKGSPTDDDQYSPYGYSTLKPNYRTTQNEKLDLSTRQTAENIVQTLITATETGPALELKISELVSATGWSEYLAVTVLNKLSETLKEGPSESWGEVFVEAFTKTTAAAWEFAKEHPVYCTLIALGLLVLLAPWALEAVGFAELGPVEGSFAAWWQSTYAGYVPKNSLFSFFQRLGMRWGAKA